MQNSGQVTDLERMIADSATAFAAAHGGPEPARAARYGTQPPSSARWPSIVELGWPGLLVREEAGGSGLGGRELAALAQALGSALLPEPVIGAIAAAALLADPALGEVARSLLEKQLGGQAIAIPAFTPMPVSEEASAFHDGHAASHVITWDASRSALVAVPSGAPGIVIARTYDGGSVGTLPRNANATHDAILLGSGDAALVAFQRAIDAVAIGTAGLLLGLARQALDITLAYLKTRRQFGVAIGSFQALQHRAATCHVSLVSSEALLRESAACLGAPNGQRACAAARLRAAETARRITEEAIQMHGAIGFADEHAVGAFYRRAFALACWHGGDAAWARRWQDIRRD